jgi:hypothetical protein
MEITYHFLVKVEIDVEKILGSYRAKEHDACEMVKLSNGSCLNRVFEHMGVPYAPHPLLGTDAFTVATKKQKVNVSRKTVMKKGEVSPVKVTLVKVAPTKKISVMKVIRPKQKLRPRGTSKIELALAKPDGVSKKFCLSDILRFSQSWHDEGGPTVQATSERASHVISFANLGDSSPDTRETSPPGKTIDVPSPPIVMPSWYSYYSFARLFCALVFL